MNNELNVPYMMVGSYSSNFYGIPRSTKDADLIFEFESSMLKEIGDRLPPELRFDGQSFFELVTATRKELLLIDGSDFQIEHWCGLHGTMELLEKARAVAGE